MNSIKLIVFIFFLTFSSTSFSKGLLDCYCKTVTNGFNHVIHESIVGVTQAHKSEIHLGNFPGSKRNCQEKIPLIWLCKFKADEPQNVCSCKPDIRPFIGFVGYEIETAIYGIGSEKLVDYYKAGDFQKCLDYSATLPACQLENH